MYSSSKNIRKLITTSLINEIVCPHKANPHIPRKSKLGLGTPQSETHEDDNTVIGKRTQFRNCAELLWGRLVPLTVWNFTSRDCNTEGVANQVILKDSITGGAEGERWECIHLHEPGLQLMV